MRNIRYALVICMGLLAAAPVFAATNQAFNAALTALRTKNFDQALLDFRALANSGHGGAAFMLGVMHEQGLGVAVDPKLAAVAYLRAAKLGDASAQYNLAVFHQLGKGVARSDAAALKWHAAAAAQGHPKAQNNLGAIYFTGAGVARDLVEAWKWLTLAADGLTEQDRKVALTNRDRIEKDLSAAELAEARRRAIAWRPH
jgi:TPR repeat protein